jgi:hypothetical protein
VDFIVRFEVKKEPAAVLGEQPTLIEEIKTKIYSAPSYCPVLIILAILIIAVIIWRILNMKSSEEPKPAVHLKRRTHHAAKPWLKSRKRHGTMHKHAK